MKTLITNAFSLNMLGIFPSQIVVAEISKELATALATSASAESVVGHFDTAKLFSSVLGIEIPANRVTVTLTSEEQLLVGQYRGPRLPEGTTTLPEGATIQWFLVYLVSYTPDRDICIHCSHDNGIIHPGHCWGEHRVGMDCCYCGGN